MDGARRVTWLLGGIRDLEPPDASSPAAAPRLLDHLAEATAQLQAQRPFAPPPLPVEPGRPTGAVGLISLQCPLSRQTFVDPVVLLADGHTYERRLLEGYLASSDISPITGEPLANKLMVVAWATRAATAAARQGLVELPVCPITLATMVEPIILADGCSYDADGLERWWRQCQAQQRPMTSPQSNQPLPAHLWASDATLAWLIDEIRMAPYPRHLAAVRGETEKLAAPSAGPAPADGSTPLMLACRHGRLDAVALLLAQGGTEQLEARDARGGTALLYACSSGHREVVALLLKRGAPCDQPGFATSRTPLMVAAAGDFQAIAELLLASGAQVWAKCSEGQFACMYARKGSRLEARLMRLWTQDMQAHGVR